MKKLLKGILAITSTFAIGATVVPAQTQNLEVSAQTKIGYAEYVSLEKAPEIDGEIDEVWSTVNSMITTVPSDDTKDDGTSGEITILWNKTGLYFLGVIYDLTVNASDLCNLWVSETFYETPKDRDTYIYILT